ncbi:MAG: type II toxin-antitoxin system VapC family toxin [Actinobacteria bacterium]|nr:type II toxin-antitoxin system VapC family toxin [Cyanobacteriota bacterium]MCL5771643.1 type II toxin-antitoxin system VapC family toxin [Actinomycetota bacterium]
MNNYFIDTSALFKRYFPEQGTEQIDDIFNQTDSTFYISDVTIIEIMSNLKRKNEITRELNSEIYSKIKKEFFNDIALENINTVDVLPENIIKAVTLIDKKYITPLDSIQLATALQLNSELQNIVFVCSDKKLTDLAEEYGIKTIII